MNRAPFVSLLAGMTLMVCVGDLAAQDQPPTRSAPRRVRPQNSLTATITANGAMDDLDDADEDGTPASTASVGDSQYQSTVSSLIRFTRSSDRSGWQLASFSTMRYYPGLEDRLLSQHGALASVTTKIGTRVSTSVTATAVYLPYYALTSFGVGSLVGENADMNAGALDYAVSRRRNITSAVDGSLSYDFSPRSTVSFGYGGQRTDFESSADPSLTTWSANARFTRKVTKNIGVRVGYGRREALFTGSRDAEPIVLNDLDVGIDYSRALSIARRTTLSFGSGSSLIDDGRGRHFEVTGIVTLSYLLGRTGNLRIGYNRGAGIREGLTRPVIADSINAGFELPTMWRVKISGLSGYSFGAVGSDGTDNGFRTFTGSVRTGVSIGGDSSLYTEYVYYRHEIGASVDLLPGVRTFQRRQTLRVGLSVGIPIVRPRVRERI